MTKYQIELIILGSQDNSGNVRCHKTPVYEVEYLDEAIEDFRNMTTLLTDGKPILFPVANDNDKLNGFIAVFPSDMQYTYRLAMAILE